MAVISASKALCGVERVGVGGGVGGQPRRWSSSRGTHRVGRRRTFAPLAVLWTASATAAMTRAWTSCSHPLGAGRSPSLVPTPCSWRRVDWYSRARSSQIPRHNVVGLGASHGKMRCVSFSLRSCVLQQRHAPILPPLARCEDEQVRGVGRNGVRGAKPQSTPLFVRSRQEPVRLTLL